MKSACHLDYLPIQESKIRIDKIFSFAGDTGMRS